MSLVYAQPVARRLVQPHQAVAWAVADIASVPADDRPHQRYFWCLNPTKSTKAVFDFALNKGVSQSSIVVRSVTVPASGGRLFRVDLRSLAPDADDYVRIHTIMERMDVEEPYFHVIAESLRFKDAVAVVVGDNGQPIIDDGMVLVHCDRYYSEADQAFVSQKWIPLGQAQEKVTAAKFAVHCGQGIEVLSKATASNNPIMRMDWFIVKALSVLDGGKYYEFMNYKSSTVPGKTDQQVFLEKFGADEELVRKLDATSRGAMFRSRVAGGRPRMVELFYGVGTRPAAGVPLIAVTHDIAAGDVDPKKHPIRNLLDFKDAAREIIVIRRNGMLGYAIFDGNGKLADSVPDFIAKDHTIPPPFDARLQPAIGCIRCHGPHDGYWPFNNDVRSMLSRLKGRPRLDVFDDISSKEAVPETLDRIAGMYALNEQEPIRLARNTYAAAVYRSTGGMSPAEAAAALSELWKSYVFDSVTPSVACAELGFAVSSGYAVQLFNQVLPPLPANRFGFSPEDPIIGALRSWTEDVPLSISRFEWEQVYADAMTRVLAQQTLLKVKEAKR